MATDQEIRDAGFKYIPQQKYLLNPFTLPTTDDGSDDGSSGGGSGVVGGSVVGGGDQGGGGNTYDNLMTNFGSTIDARQSRLENPSKISKFLERFGLSGQRSVDQMMRDSTAYNMNKLGPDFSQIGITSDMTGPEIQKAMAEYAADETSIGNYPVGDPRDVRKNMFGLGGILSQIVPSSYYDKFTVPEQIYTQSKMGYTGPTVFGENNSGLQKDIFGRNVVSGFGNYAEKQAKDIQKLNDLYTSENFTNKYGNLKLEEDDEGIFGFTGGTKAQRDRAAKMHKLNLIRYNYDKKGLRELEDIKNQTGDTDVMAAQNAATKAAASRELQERMTNIGNVTPGQQAQANADYQRMQRAYREDTGPGPGSYAPGGGSGSHAADESGSTYSDPFDQGGGEKDGGFIDGSNRRPFAYGGLASIL